MSKYTHKSLSFLGFPDYCVSNKGTVWSHHYGYWKKIKAWEGDGGAFDREQKKKTP